MKHALQHQVRRRWLSLSTHACAVCLALALGCGIATSQQLQVTLDPAETQVNISVHDVHGGVHGSFKLKSGSILFDRSSSKAAGEIVVDATSGNTGNSTRDRKMKQEVLEGQRYPEIIFVPTRVIGEVATQGNSDIQVQGTFRIHGASHEITLTVPVQVSGDKVTAATNFVVPYESWGMKNPSVLFLRVDGQAQISINATGRIVAVNGGNAAR